MAAASDRAGPDAGAGEPSLRLRRAPSAEAGDLAGDSSGGRRENGDPHPPPNPQERQQQHEMLYYRASAPAHRRVKESPLSSDAIFRQSHAGLLNLCIVVLIAVNSRLIIENLMKYGLLIRAGFWFSARSLGDWPLLMCW
jgi:diacylglycerol O-acyltransferase-1